MGFSATKSDVSCICLASKKRVVEREVYTGIAVPSGAKILIFLILDLAYTYEERLGIA
jgi:hypothetical protein